MSIQDFDDKDEEVTQSTSSVGDNENDTTPVIKEDKDSDVKMNSFQDHPRWKEMHAKAKLAEDAMGKAQALEEELNSYKRRVDPILNQFNNEEPIPEWWAGDRESWNQFSGYIGSRERAAKEAALQELTSKQQAERKAYEEAVAWIDQNVRELEETHGKPVDRNKLLKYAADNEVVDLKNRYNLKVAYKLMQAEEAQPVQPDLNIRKRAISIDSTGDNPDTLNKKIPSYESFRDGTFRKAW